MLTSQEDTLNTARDVECPFPLWRDIVGVREVYIGPRPLHDLLDIHTCSTNNEQVVLWSDL